MTDFTRGLDRRTFIFGAAALGAATLLRPTLAFAEPTSADKFAEADSGSRSHQRDAGAADHRR